jgi:hypothetical protein
LKGGRGHVGSLPLPVQCYHVALDMRPVFGVHAAVLMLRCSIWLIWH